MTIRKIVVATDFSGFAAIALHQGLAIARRHGAELVVVYANHPGARPADLPALRGVQENYERFTRDHLAEVRRRLESLRDRIDGDGASVSQLIVEGRPQAVIPQVAVELGADLVVVGTHGRTGFRRFALGSVAESVVRATEANVLVARAPAESGTTPVIGGGDPRTPRASSEGKYSKVLVPVDFSRYTTPAIEIAMQLVAEDGEVELFHAWEVPTMTWAGESWVPDWTELRCGLVEANHKLGSELVSGTAKPEGVRLSFFQRETRPNVGIQLCAEEGGHDLIVMGSHGRRGLARWALGSVAEVIVRHAPCSVLVVHMVPE